MGNSKQDDLFFLPKRVARLEALLKGVTRKSITDATSGSSDGAELSVSEEELSKYFLTNEDGTLSIDGIKIRNANSTHQVEYHRIAPSLLASEPYTTGGAMSAATINDATGTIVVAGDGTSYMLLTNVKRADWHCEHRLKFKVTTLGTASLVGFLFMVTTGGGTDLSPTNQSFIYNLNSESALRGASNGSYPTPNTGFTTATYNTSGAAAFCQNGDIIEMFLVTDPFTFTVRLTAFNLTRGYVMSSMQTYASAADNSYGNKNSNIGFIIADGSYTFMEYSLKSLTPAKPLIAIVGDSYGSGYQNVAAVDTIWGRLNASLPYNVVNYASSGASLHGLNQVVLRELLLMRPKVVVQISVLSPYVGQFISDLATYQAAMDAQLLTIRSYGGIAVLVKYEATNPYAATNRVAWATYVDTQVAAYPGTLVLDLSAETGMTYTSSHWSAVSTLIVKNKLIELLETNNLL